MLEEIEKTLDQAVRPLLGRHGGGICVKKVCGGVVTVRMTGGCAGCPSALETLESIVSEALLRVDGVKEVVLDNSTDPELMAFARKLLAEERGG